MDLSWLQELPTSRYIIWLKTLETNWMKQWCPRLTGLNPSSDRWTPLPGLDVITAEYGGTCWYQGKNIVSVQMNQSNMVDTNVSWPLPLSSAKTYSPNSSPSSWFHTSCFPGSYSLSLLQLYYVLFWCFPPALFSSSSGTSPPIYYHQSGHGTPPGPGPFWYRFFRVYNDTSPL